MTILYCFLDLGDPEGARSYLSVILDTNKSMAIKLTPFANYLPDQSRTCLALSLSGEGSFQLGVCMWMSE